MNALALCHTSVHHTGDIAKYGLNVRVADCGDFRQVFGNRFRFYWLTLHDGARVMHFLF
jgi:hypothetical protein